ncbi:5'-AMP-activated protein kinase subunit beta-2 [Phytophthora nicotianae]|uniref:5'-AMP-activated protein kinase subunit beta-2 n=1 Tax=Phytophthora nicotianae TaxID=4792 RepID=A0A0W8DN34_PHYNI|nr:5'-AMP-activated protein kinase subunit beta-2 [Phytophthora nicotianae]
MNVRLLALLGAALAAHTASAVTTCPVSVQSKTTSTLTHPITKVVSSTSSGSGSEATSSSSGSGTNFSDAGSQGSQNADVGSSSSGSSTSTTAGSSGGTSTGTGTTTGSDDSTGSAGVPTTTTTPSSTTKTPSTTTASPSTTTTPSTTTGSASTTTTTGSATTAPSTDTTATVSTSSGSSGTAAGTTASLSLGVRKLQATTTTTTGTTGSTTDSSGSVADAAKKQQRAQDEADGVITKDNTTTTGSVVAATSKSVAGVTVAVTGIAAIASTAVGGVSSAGASLAAAGSTMAITTVEICQFGVLVNQLQLDGKSSALAQFGKAMAPAAFTFLPFGKLDDSESDGSSSGSGSESSSGSVSGRRLEGSSASGSGSSSSTSQLTGIERYSRQLNIKEDMLFIVTLAGVFCVMASVVGLFGIGYLLSGLMMPREEYLTKFFDKMIGLEVLVAILSQYTIGVTATFQIYYSTKYESITDPKCLLAIAAILFLAAGILVYGYIVIKKHEAEITDVGTVQHLKKTVNMRYGPLYEEYKFKNRYFFAAKMMLALTTGVITGCASMSGKVQVSLILALNVLFFFYLEIQSPHHSKFVQTTTSFVSIMKIAVLVLTFFLITAATSDGFPTSLQNGISVAIVGLNLFVLALLMIRSLYTFWQKMKLQRDAAYDQEEQTAQDYFKDETPAGARKDRAPATPDPVRPACSPVSILERQHEQQQPVRPG